MGKVGIGLTIALWFNERAARICGSLLNHFAERLARLERKRDEQLGIALAVERGGSSREFAKLHEMRTGKPFPPMHLEHGVTMNREHDAFALENPIASEPLSADEREAMALARALSGGSTEHIR